MLIEKTSKTTNLKKEIGRYKSRINQLEQELQCYKNKEVLPDGLDYLDIIIENVNDPVIIKDPDGCILYVNQAWCTAFKFSKREVLHKKDNEIIDPAICNILKELDKDVLIKGKTFSIDEYDNTNGFSKQFDTLRLPLKYPGSNRIRGVITIYRDQYNSLNAEKLWFKLIEAGTDGLWDWDFVKNCFKPSSKMADFIGTYKKTLNTEEWYALIHPDDIDHMIIALSNHFSRKDEVYTCHYRIMNKNGNYVKIIDTGLVFERDMKNEVVRMIGITSFADKE